MNENYSEGSGMEAEMCVQPDICIKLEQEDCDDESLSTMSLLELAECVQSNQEPIEFDNTDAMVDPKSGRVICMHCFVELDPNLISDHMVNVHNYRRIYFKCHNCQMSFLERKLLRAHRETCMPKKKQKLKNFAQIMRACESKDFLEDPAVAVNCPICTVELPKYFLKGHLLAYHNNPEPTYPCDVCHKEFKAKLSMKEHKKLVHESINNSEECNVCGQTFKSVKYLANHKRNVHPTGGKVHKCPTCGKEFKSHHCLHQHNKYVHPPESAIAECPHCPKLFKSKYNLSQHLKVAHGKKKE